MQLESEIQAQIRLALGREPDLVLWRNNTGVAHEDGRRIRYGLTVGGADLIGILTGRFIALEVKRPKKGRESEEQQMFMQLVRAKGGFAAFVRSVDEARAAIQRAREGSSE